MLQHGDNSFTDFVCYKGRGIYKKDPSFARKKNFNDRIEPNENANNSSRLFKKNNQIEALVKQNRFEVGAFLQKKYFSDSCFLFTTTSILQRRSYRNPTSTIYMFGSLFQAVLRKRREFLKRKGIAKEEMSLAEIQKNEGTAFL